MDKVEEIENKLGEAYPEEEDWDDESFVKYGFEYMKFMFDGIESFSDLAEQCEDLAKHFTEMDNNYKMIAPVDGGHFDYARKDGRNVYTEEGNTLTLAEYDDTMSADT